MAIPTTDLLPVSSRIEKQLLEQLDKKTEESGRSRDKEIRQAIRAWVMSPEAEREQVAG